MFCTHTVPEHESKHDILTIQINENIEELQSHSTQLETTKQCMTIAHYVPGSLQAGLTRGLLLLMF